MEPPASIETPEGSTKHSSQNKNISLNRSAPLYPSNPRLTPCRRMGLKRKSTPGNGFRSPLKDDSTTICNVELKLPAIKFEDDFSDRSPQLSSPNENDHEASLSNSRVLETPNSSCNNESAAVNHKSNKRLMIRNSKSFTPNVPKSLTLKTCSLSKRLKLTEDCSTAKSKSNTKQEEVDHLSYSELTEVLNKDHNNFMEIYDGFTPDKERECNEEDTLKQDTLVRMKKIFDQIVQVKESLLNAKQVFMQESTLQSPKAKHDISNLEMLTGKWRDGCQKALLIWLDKLQEQGHKCDMTQLLQESGIPSKIVRYDEETQDFIT